MAEAAATAWRGPTDRSVRANSSDSVTPILNTSEGAAEHHVPTPAESPNVAQRVEAIVRSLHVRLGEGFDRTAIAAEVDAEFAMYSTATVAQYVPILVERGVWARLSGQLSAPRDGPHRRNAG